MNNSVALPCSPLSWLATHVLTADFDYELPAELIAQAPLARRDESRLLALSRSSGELRHLGMRSLPELLHPGDLLVLNDSRVLPARLRATRPESGSEIELLLLEECGVNDWWCMAKPAKKLKENKSVTLLDRVRLPTDVTATLRERNAEGHCRLLFEGVENLRDQLPLIGELPLPPYIERAGMICNPDDWTRYQTVFAAKDGSVAAPTAGLHFTPELLAEIQQRGVGVCSVTLHVGVGTFAPVKVDNVEEHRMHSETYDVSEAAAEAINAARRRGNRVVAVGTTSMRTLESVARENGGSIGAGRGRTNIFIKPPHQFLAVDALLTNFHLPRSTLLMLVSAFAAPGQVTGRELVLHAYREAIRERYRFFSYGDAMFIA